MTSVPEIPDTKVETKIDSSRPYLFFADFADGYSMRQLVEFYHQAIPMAPMRFQKDGIIIERGNGPDTMITQTRIDGKKLLKYYIAPDREGHTINLKLDEFHAHIKPVGKKESFRLSQFIDTPDIVRITFYGGSKTAGTWIDIRTQPFEPIQYELEPPGSSRPPNINVALTPFCSALANLAKIRDLQDVVLMCFAKGAMLGPPGEATTSCRITMWGDYSEKPSVIYIKSGIIKAMSKLNNVNQNGVVRITAVGDGVVKIELDVGHYGDLTIYLQNAA